MYDLLMLAMLLRGPKHGYQLKRETVTLIGGGRLHNNQVYPALRRFVGSRWVTRKLVPGNRGQTRHLYSLTPRGRRELIARLSRFTDEDAANAASFWFRVGLFGLLQSDVRNHILHARETYLRARHAALTDVPASGSLDLYAGEVTSHVKTEIEAELGWIARLRKTTNL
jgi:DNA-binding PadR family transcriptional regulator